MCIEDVRMSANSTVITSQRLGLEGVPFPIPSNPRRIGLFVYADAAPFFLAYRVGGQAIMFAGSAYVGPVNSALGMSVQSHPGILTLGLECTVMSGNANVSVVEVLLSLSDYDRLVKGLPQYA